MRLGGRITMYLHYDASKYLEDIRLRFALLSCVEFYLEFYRNGSGCDTVKELGKMVDYLRPPYTREFLA